MSFQTCPNCNGTGFSNHVHFGIETCGVCEGSKIINELTGEPLKKSKTNLEFNNFPQKFEVTNFPFPEVTAGNFRAIEEVEHRTFIDSHIIDFGYFVRKNEGLSMRETFLKWMKEECKNVDKYIQQMEESSSIQELQNSFEEQGKETTLKFKNDERH